MKKKMILFDIFLCVFITFTAACFAIKPIVVKTISSNISGVAISHQLMDDIYKIFPNASTNDMLMVQNEIADSKAVRKITQSYIDQIIKNRKQTISLETNDKDFLRLRDETIAIVEKNIGVNISAEQRLSLLNMINEHKETMISQLETTIGYFGSIRSNDQFSLLFQLYAIFSSLLFQVICIFVTAAFVYALIRISSLNKAISHITVCLIIAAFCLYVVIPNMSDSILATLSNHVLGRTTFFDFSPMKTAGIVQLILAGIVGIFAILLHYKEINTQDTIHLA